MAWAQSLGQRFIFRLMGDVTARKPEWNLETHGRVFPTDFLQSGTHYR